MKPEYLIHPYISGNKFRKLKYNMLEAKKLGCETLLTFGGAYSNHIAATAYAGKIYGFKTVGVIRGEELQVKVAKNPTLYTAHKNGMSFCFVSRSAYREKTKLDLLDSLGINLHDCYILPEGGTNELAVKGCEEILIKEDLNYDFICCSVGTGGTIAGLINCSDEHQKILGFPALKGDFIREDILKFAKKKNWELIHDYHFGGYGKITSELITFINEFKMNYKVPLDPIYTGKMMFGIFDLMSKGFFPKASKILAIHTGGLQGIKGMNIKLEQKNLPLIE